MTGLATALDHVGVAVPDLDAAAAEWAALGFTVQPLLPHMHAGAPTGTGNRNIMLGAGYIELLATIDPAKPSGTIACFLASHTGIHVLTLATDDEEAAQARLNRAGFAAAISRSSRPAPPADGEAGFARIPLAEADPRLQLLRHLTPALVWQPPFLAHPNRAGALEDVIVVADPPAGFAARLSRAAGRPVVPDPEGGLALRLPQGTVRVLAPDAALRLLPGATLPALPAILGIAIRTQDGNAAVAALLGERPGGLLLARASGVIVRFLG
jgi:catechol 2,3-dioxygenase-like lactoylglutathione lyase family enzyme